MSASFFISYLFFSLNIQIINAPYCICASLHNATVKIPKL